jgi:DNA-binding response OmpR family regulator
VRILLIEDEPDLRSEIREYLQRRGHEVTDCGALGEGRTLVQRLVADAAPPDAIVCDVNLPDGNGVDFYLAAASGLPDCQWVLMSGAHDLDRVDKAGGQVGASSCTIVDKPVSLRELSAVLVRK